MSKVIIVVALVLSGSAILALSTGYCRIQPWYNGYWYMLILECHT